MSGAGGNGIEGEGVEYPEGEKREGLPCSLLIDHVGTGYI
jgi:hypothetical protein